METAFERRLHNVVGELQNSPMLEVRQLTERPPAEHLGNAEEALAMIGDYMGMTLPPGLGVNFHRHIEFHLEWRANQPHDGVGGEFLLEHIGVAIMSVAPEWPVDLASNDEEEELFGQFRFFDRQPSGLGTLSGIRLANNVEPTEVWYYNPQAGFRFLKMDLDYGGFLDTLLLTRGFHYWQYLFTDPAESMTHLRWLLKLLNAGLDFLARAFPADEFSGLYDRLAIRQRAVDEYWAEYEG